MPKPRNDLLDRTADGAARLLLGGLGALPYERRIPASGALFARVVGPALGWTERARRHVALAMPELPDHERARIARGSIDNAGRSIAEMYAGEAFLRRVQDLPLGGPGAPALAAAKRDGRPVIAVAAHLGNYNAARAAVIAKGHRVGSLYRRMSNPRFEPHYARAMEGIGGPLFAARDRAGMAALLRHLRGGGLLAVLTDLHVHGAPALRFFGRPANTALTAAELAARYDALLLPVNALRRADGLSFDVVVGPEAPPGTPAERMQWLNDEVERIVRAHPAQWWWVPRRWR